MAHLRNLNYQSLTVHFVPQDRHQIYACPEKLPVQLPFLKNVMNQTLYPLTFPI